MPLGGWGEGKGKRAGDDGKKSSLFPSYPARSLFFTFLFGIPVGASAEERYQFLFKNS